MTNYFQSGLLKSRAALVTGGGTGICRGIALALASVGCDVAITSRSQEHLEPTVGDIRNLGVRPLPSRLSVFEDAGRGDSQHQRDASAPWHNGPVARVSRESGHRCADAVV